MQAVSAFNNTQKRSEMQLVVSVQTVNLRLHVFVGRIGLDATDNIGQKIVIDCHFVTP